MQNKCEQQLLDRINKEVGTKFSSIESMIDGMKWIKHRAVTNLDITLREDFNKQNASIADDKRG
jgi:hypothetical protein